MDMSCIQFAFLGSGDGELRGSRLEARMDMSCIQFAFLGEWGWGVEGKQVGSKDGYVMHSVCFSRGVGMGS